MQRWPDFFVVGAPKAATTSLHHYLGQHPELFTSRIKEPHFFSWPEVADTYYRTRFVTSEADYLALYEACPTACQAGDFSTSYLFSPGAAERIADRCPDAKIVIVLRDPVDRALSHHRMDLRDGYTSEPIELLIAASATDKRFRREYIDVGHYADQIKRYTDRFASDQVHVMLYDNVTADLAGELKSLLEFLGVDEAFTFDLSATKNTSREPASNFAAAITRSTAAARLRPLVPQQARAVARRALTRPGTSTTSSTTLELLDAEFADEIDALEGLLDIDLDAWRR